MRILPPALSLALAAAAQACAGGQAAQRPDPTPEVEAPPAAEPAPSAEASPTAQTAASATTAPAGAPPPLPAKVDAGPIPRPDVRAVLEGGVARFLQRMQTEAHLERGRFVGWRLLNTYPREDALTPEVLAPGDTVMKVNGQSIERPEQFKNVWDAMATSSELVLEVRRGETDSTVRYTIVD